MRIKYLGTAAAEGIPALFCSCKICSRSSRAGGRNIRTRSQAVLDDRLLIDFPPDTYMHMLYGGLDLKNIHSCIITHNHTDHFYPEDFIMRGNWFAIPTDAEPLMVYMTDAAFSQTVPLFERWGDEFGKRVKVSRITPFDTFSCEGYDITPLPANHDAAADPVIYLIKEQATDKYLLYGNDTGYFTEDTWHFLEKRQPHLNLISLDCTAFGKDTKGGHMGLPNVLKVLERLKMSDIIADDTIKIINHFSHFGGYTYDTMTPIAEKEGLIVSYDNMVAEV